MYVCVCHAITDSQIKVEISRGARRLCDLKQRLGLCSQCGKCGQHARQLLEAERAQLDEGDDSQALSVAVPA
jgi:bacterioferritin-associated ferredoxin